MDREGLPPLALIVGVGLILLAAIAFFGVSVVRNAAAPPATATPLPPTATAVPTPAPEQSSSSGSAANVAASSPTVVPAAVPNLPETAPDFTLQGAKGITLTLSDQLAKGPVVLVFFSSGGG